MSTSDDFDISQPWRISPWPWNNGLDASGKPLVFQDRRVTVGRNEEHQSNRQALDAAPDMLAALEAAPVIRLGESLDEFSVRYRHWFTEIRRYAIAKAKGAA